LEYEAVGHLSAAVGFYIRTAEFGADDLLTYESLCRISLCVQRQGGRPFTVTGSLLRAVALIPERPEARYLLSRAYELDKKWQECYAWSVMGERDFAGAGTFPPLRTDVLYPGAWGFTFERLTAASYIGHWNESLALMKQLIRTPGVRPEVLFTLKKDLARMWVANPPLLPYDATMYPRLRCKFPGAESIKENYSQAFQDMFVLAALNGKREGEWVEIGCGHPTYGNNTYLLEREFGWTGCSVDIDPKAVEKFKAERGDHAVVADATKLDFGLLPDGDYDYLQIDCDPSQTSLLVLKRIPFHSHRFAVITFEHDYSNGDDPTARDESRRYLRSLGYVLVVSNVAVNRWYSFEDWWIHPDLVDGRIVERLTSLSDQPQQADMYFTRLT